MATSIPSPRLAVLIDADNASSRIAEALFEEIATIGEASVRRIYGDFSGTRLKSWADVLTRHAIMPHQNFANTKGKNASDIALVIDAMDLLHSGRFDGFCLVSSDSDFTRLAARIREQGVDVFGFGEHKTPHSFIQACKRFIYTENLLPESAFAAPADGDTVIAERLSACSAKHVGDNAPGAPASSPAARSPADAIPLIRKALAQMEDRGDGWYPMGRLGGLLEAMNPDFDRRTYGCSKLVTLVEKSGQFDVTRDIGKAAYLRPKNPASSALPPRHPEGGKA